MTMEIMKSGPVYILCLIYSVYAIVQQIDLWKVSNTFEVRDGKHFNVTNRLKCAQICCKDVVRCGFFFSQVGHCQCLNQHEGFEFWTVTTQTNYQERVMGPAFSWKQMLKGRLILLPVTVSYMGCYEDKWDRALPLDKMVDRTALTTESCMHHCINYVYFGTEIGAECYCSDVIKSSYNKMPEKECNVACSGDRSLMCGGHFKISIYKINA